MQNALTSVLNRAPRYAFCDDLFIEGVSLAPLQVYSRFSTRINRPRSELLRDAPDEHALVEA